MSIGFIGRDRLAAGLQCEADVSATARAAPVRDPLELSPGRDDFGPDLALASKSSGANSPVGADCALDGLLFMAVDTTEGVPRYDETDRDLFAGMGLIPEIVEGPTGGQSFSIGRGVSDRVRAHNRLSCRRCGGDT